MQGFYRFSFWQTTKKTFICVLELKVDDTVDNALAQIDSKDYAIFCLNLNLCLVLK